MSFKYLMSGESNFKPLSYFIYTETVRDKTKIGIRYKIDWMIQSGYYYGYNIILSELWTEGILHARNIEIKGSQPNKGSGSFYYPRDGYLWFDKGYTATEIDRIRFKFTSSNGGNGSWDIGYDSYVYVPMELIASTISTDVSFDLGATDPKLRIYFNDVTNVKYTYQVDIYLEGEPVTSFLGLDLKYFDLSFLPSEIDKMFEILKNKKSGTLKVNLQTFYNNGYIGVTDRYGTVNIVNSNPTVSNFTYEDINTTVTSVTNDNQVIMQNLSRIKITSSIAVAKNKATITQYEINSKGTIYTSNNNVINIETLNESTNIILTVTDSRGFTSSISKIIEVIPYTLPQISSLNFKRLDDIENQVFCTMNATYSDTIPLPDVDSVKSISLTYNVTSSSSVSSYEMKSKAIIENGTIKINNQQIIDFDNEKSFDMKVTLTDAFGKSVSKQVILPTGKPLFSIEKEHIGVGKMPNSKYFLDIEGLINLNSDLYFKTKFKLSTDTSNMFINDSKIILQNNPDFMIFRGTLTKDTNLNRLTDFGIYYVSTNTGANQVPNIPVSEAGVLEVLRWGGADCIQRYTPYTAKAQYIRRYYSYESSWSTWTMFQQGKSVELFKGQSSGNAVINGTVKVNLSDSWWNYDYLVVYIANGTSNERTSVTLFPNKNHECFYHLYVLSTYQASGLVSLSDDGANISFTVKEVTGWSTSTIRIVEVIGIQL